MKNLDMNGETMHFVSICTKNWCFYGNIKITGEGDDDFEVTKLEIVRHGCGTNVLGLVDRDIMAELRVELRQFRRHPEWYEEDPHFYG